MRAVILSALLLSSCLPGLELEQPDRRNARSIIILVDDGEKISGVARAVSGDEPFAFSMVEGSELLLLHYDRTLDQLLLEEGPIVPPLFDIRCETTCLSGCNLRRNLPRPRAAYHSTGELWKAVPDIASHQTFRSFEVEELRPEQCVEQGGCFDNDPDGLCQIPCPEQQAPAQPESPELPRLGPCTHGEPRTEETVAGSFEACIPFRDGVPHCAEGELAYPTQPACHPVSDCAPPGEWASDLPTTTAIIYVREDAEDGDGTRSDPFESVDEALAVAPPGAIIALTAGTYETSGILSDDVTFHGACAGSTVLKAPAGLGLWVVDNAQVVIKKVWLQAEDAPTLHSVGGLLRLDEVIVTRAGPERSPLIAVTGGRFEAQRLKMRSNQAVFVQVDPGDVSLNAIDFRGGRRALRGQGDARIDDALIQGAGERGSVGIEVGSGHLELRRALLFHHKSEAVGLYASSGVIEDVVLRNTQVEERTWGLGLLAVGSTVTATRIVLEENRVAGVVLSQGAHVHLEDIVVKGTVAEERAGGAVMVSESSSLVLERGVMKGNIGDGIWLLDDPNHAQVSDLVVMECIETDKVLGSGITVRHPARLELRRAVLSGQCLHGLRVRNSSSRTAFDESLVDAEDVTIRANRLGGLSVYGRVGVKLERGLFQENKGMSVFADQDWATATLTDITIENTLPGTDYTSCPTLTAHCEGTGVVSSVFAQIAIDRFAIRGGSSAYGVVVTDSELTLDRGVIEGHEVGLIWAAPEKLRQVSTRVVYRDNNQDLSMCRE